MVAILEATNMSELDLQMTLDGETAWVLGQPSPLAAPAQAAHEALRRAHETATLATDPFSPDDAPTGVGIADQAGRVEMEAGRDLMVGPPAEEVSIGPDVQGPPTGLGAIAQTPPSVPPAPGAPAPAPAPNGQVVIHAVNYYARPASSLSDLPNEWAGNRARP